MRTTRVGCGGGVIKYGRKQPCKSRISSSHPVSRICRRLWSSLLRVSNATPVVRGTCPWRLHFLILKKHKTADRSRLDALRDRRALLMQRVLLFLLLPLRHCLCQLMQYPLPRERRRHRGKHSRGFMKKSYLIHFPPTWNCTRSLHQILHRLWNGSETVSCLQVFTTINWKLHNGSKIWLCRRPPYGIAIRRSDSLKGPTSSSYTRCNGSWELG